MEMMLWGLSSTEGLDHQIQLILVTVLLRTVHGCGSQTASTLIIPPSIDSVITLRSVVQIRMCTGTKTKTTHRMYFLGPK